MTTFSDEMTRSYYENITPLEQHGDRFSGGWVGIYPEGPDEMTMIISAHYEAIEGHLVSRDALAINWLQAVAHFRQDLPEPSMEDVVIQMFANGEHDRFEVTPGARQFYNWQAIWTYIRSEYPDKKVWLLDTDLNFSVLEAPADV